MVDQWQLEKLGLVTVQFEVFYYVSGLSEEYCELLLEKVFNTVNAAVKAQLQLFLKVPMYSPVFAILQLLPNSFILTDSRIEYKGRSDRSTQRVVAQLLLFS